MVHRTQNQALEQTRDSVLRYGEVVGCELLNFFVRCRKHVRWSLTWSAIGERQR
jgi:hypothetical protein